MKRIIQSLLAIFGLLTLYSVLSVPFGWPRPGFLTPLITLVGFSFGLLHASQRMGWKKALGLLVFVFGVSLSFESLGVATGIIYGPYHYTLKLGPLFLGLVPFLIPVAWFMMMYPAFVIADWLIPLHCKGWQRLLGVAAVGGLAMTAWDVVMDPLMVRGGHWVWDVNGAYFGVPLQNYFGWWLTVFTTFALFMLVLGWQRPAFATSFERLAVFAYLVTGLGNVLVAGMTGLGGPALAGFFAMAPWVVIGWLHMPSD